MIKLALVGKNIQHSLSPLIYKKIFGDRISYDLLDYSQAADVPDVQTLFKTYRGINITSPYKKIFLNQVVLTDNARGLNAINCLRKDGDKIIGENTDYLAIVDILLHWKCLYGEMSVALLGDGVMAGVTEVALNKLGIKYLQFSRKKTTDFSQLNLSEAFDKSDQNTMLIINTCARDFIFNGRFPQKSIFWDYNYNFEPHRKLADKLELYSDGRDMLERQAKYAAAFWSLNSDFI
jgi:shikimate dehydrogenase